MVVSPHMGILCITLSQAVCAYMFENHVEVTIHNNVDTFTITDTSLMLQKEYNMQQRHTKALMVCWAVAVIHKK